MCCDICLRLFDYCEGNNVICGRTMEFAEPLNSKLCFVPRNGNLYGFIGVKILDTDVIVDGMNEKGLSCGILVMDDTIYHPMTENSVAITNICSYILSLCSTTDEAITILNNINIHGVSIPVINRLLGLHIVVHDIHGINIVCEINTENEIYYTDGVVTNGPNYPSQLVIWNDYIHNNYVPNKSHWSSIARFIKLSELKRISIPESYDALGLVQLICRICNNVDIIRGVSESEREYGIIYGTTQWSIIKDLTSKIIYFRSQNNMTLRRIDLNNIDFSGATSYTEISIDDLTPTIIDIVPKVS